MINISAWVTENPQNKNGITTYQDCLRVVPVSRISNRGSNSHPRYYGLVVEPEKFAPNEPSIFIDGVWVPFYKKDNTSIKLPLLKVGEAINV